MADFQKEISAILRKMRDRIESLDEELKELKEGGGGRRPATVREEVAQIPGRRVFYGLVGTQKFTSANQGRRGDPIPFRLSTDGPFVMTHWPVVGWRPTKPSNATNLKRWSPIVSSVPDQEIANIDTLDITWEFGDSGSSRQFSNEAMPPFFSKWGEPSELPDWTMFQPNATIQFIPTYERVFFNSSPSVATTEGELVVMLPGFKIAYQ